MPSRWKIELRDRAFHSQLLRKLRAQYLLARLPRVKNDSSVAAILKRIDALCRLAREERPGRVEALEDEIRRLASLTAGRPVDWGSVVSGWTPERIEKGVLLKPWLGEREKGVVLVSFGYQWMRLAGIRNLEEFAQRYTLITAPSWTPPHGIENAVFFAHYPAERVFSLISNPAEMAILPRLSRRFRRSRSMRRTGSIRNWESRSRSRRRISIWSWWRDLEFTNATTCCFRRYAIFRGACA